MINNNLISVIIPAYNEEDIIDETLNKLDQEWIDEIIVINDGSSDNTSILVKKFPVTLLDLAENTGKGNAVTRGIIESRGDILVILDADLGESVSEIEKLLIPLLEDNVDASIAIIPINGGGLGMVRKLATAGLKYMTGKTMTAPLSGQRAFKREVIYKLLPLQDGFGLEMGLNISLIKEKIKFAETECNFKHRITGHDYYGYIHRLKQFSDIVKTMWILKRGKYV